MKNIALLGLLALMPAFSQQPKFGLADIHVSTTPRWFVTNYEKNGSARITGHVVEGRYIVRDASLLTLIEAAYGVTDETIAGGPSWLGLDLYDVVAKVPEGTTQATADLMLQSLLAERFGLVARRDTRPLPRYVLSVSKSGSKLKPAAQSEDSGCKQQLAGPMPAAPFTPAQIPNTKVTCHSLTSTQIVENLRQIAGAQINTYLPREVIDSTGLEGKWDFEFEFTPIAFVGDKGAEGITLFDALSKQLGLTLELKGVPVPALSIEKVNRNPTPNPPAVKTDLALTTTQFEVASIKPIDPKVGRVVGSRSFSEVKMGGTLRGLITQAFMITPNSAYDVIIGLPKSADSQIWEITAKLPSTGEGALTGTGVRPVPPQRSVFMEMLRNLLAAQFGLKTHTENRQVTVYAMTKKGKLKMEQGNPAERAACYVDPTAVKPYPNMGTMVTCRNYSVAAYAEDLNQVTGSFDHPIVDASGLKGGWNFSIGWSRDQAPPVNQGGANGQATDPTGLTPYEAVERLMGLKLVKQKRSIPVIVVDHVEEKPLE